MSIPATNLPTAVWVDPAGTSWPLTDSRRVADGGPGWFTPAPGPSGHTGPPPVTLVSDPQERGGVKVRWRQPNPRVITWPLYVEGDTHGEFLARWRALAESITSTVRSGAGQLVITRPDGTSREILAEYQDGFEGQPDLGIRADAAAINLFCPDGYWRDTETTPVVRAGLSTAQSYYKHFPRVSSSQQLGGGWVGNPGDVEAWPRWTVSGPASALTATNSTRGESFTLDVFAYRGSALLAGEQVIIDTETGAVTGPDGSSWAGAIDWTQSTLWRLDGGNSFVTITISGASSVTEFSSEFYARHTTS